MPVAQDPYEHVRDSGVLRELQDKGWIVETSELPRDDWPVEAGDAAYLLEHRRVEFISHPYEWSFSGLKAAALLHLDLQLFLFDRGFVLSDASAYNLQFEGPRPIFIDVLSLRPYAEGEFWVGHHQFCEQFLNPLLLRALAGVAPNSWYRGALEGIPTTDLARLVPLRRRFSWNVLSQVLMQAGLERRAIEAPEASLQRAKAQHRLPRLAYRGMLTQLRNWICRLQPPGETTTWSGYAADNSYAADEAAAKRDYIRDFAASVRPGRLVDIGCNTGEYAKAALEGGAGAVTGFDFDHQAIDAAYRRAVGEGLDFLPLWLDAANPSPSQGWRQAERQGFEQRVRADAVVALAFEHHLAIGRNLPLAEVVEWLVAIAPQGVIEFVPKADPTVARMLALREDIFPDYTADAFRAALADAADIVDAKTVSASGRTLYRFARRS
jgi:ribosomal protein L11 methylase PrmA